MITLLILIIVSIVLASIERYKRYMLEKEYDVLVSALLLIGAIASDNEKELLNHEKDESELTDRLMSINSIVILTSLAMGGFDDHREVLRNE